MNFVYIRCGLWRCGVDQQCGRACSNSLNEQRSYILAASLFFAILALFLRFQLFSWHQCKADTVRLLSHSCSLALFMVIMSSGIIFGYRVSVLWNGRKSINCIVGLLYLFMTVSWVGLSGRLLFSTYVLIFQLGGCGLTVSGNKQKYQFSIGVWILLAVFNCCWTVHVL